MHYFSKLNQLLYVVKVQGWREALLACGVGEVALLADRRGAAG
jgi:hypothetical protein